MVEEEKWESKRKKKREESTGNRVFTIGEVRKVIKKSTFLNI